MLQDSIAIIFYVVAGGALLGALYSMFVRRRKKIAEEQDPRSYPVYGPGDATNDGGGGGGGD